MVAKKGGSTFQVRSLDTLNINVSEMLCENLINAKDSWDSAYTRFVDDIEHSSRPRLGSRLSVNSGEYHIPEEGDPLEALTPYGGGGGHKPLPLFDNISTPMLGVSREMTDHLSMRNNEDTVSPYTIENYSGFRIFVVKMIGQQQSAREGIH